MLLVDSSVYIDYLRAAQDPVVRLEPWIASGELLCCGIIRCEVLRGIRVPRVRARMSDLFDIAADAPFTADMWSRTAELAWTLDRSGVILPLTDLAIAACAFRYHADVVATDPHFQSIPGLSVRQTLPRRP